MIPIHYAEKLHTEELTPLTNYSPTTVKTSSGIFKITETKREMSLLNNNYVLPMSVNFAVMIISALFKLNYLEIYVMS